MRTSHTTLGDCSTLPLGGLAVPAVDSAPWRAGVRLAADLLLLVPVLAVGQLSLDLLNAGVL